MHPSRLLALGLLLAANACRTAHRPTFAIETRRDDTLRRLASGDVVGGAGRYGSHAWLGIPYAAPPVGELRWRGPRPAAPWTTPLEALAFKPPCPQLASPLGGVEAGRDDGTVGEEDCLALNVYAPPFDAAAVPQGAARLPVMVWIHGGGNSIGTAAFYDGGRLATSGPVVVVTLQYRLGPLGWFRHAALRDGLEDPAEQSGNFGTLDQVAALEWVRDNVSAFGGDPGNVTIFGESAGGQDVFALLVSPRAKGLFHRAIAQSGGLSRTTTQLAEHFSDAPEPGHLNSSSEVLARFLVQDGAASDRAAAKAKLAAMAPAEVAKFARSKSAAELLHIYQSDAGGGRLGMLDMPLVVKDGALLPAGDWLDAFRRADGWNRVPVIVGTNRDEAKLFFALDPALTWKFLGLVPRMRDEAKYLATADTVSHLWKAVGADGPAQAMVASGATQVYSYRFDWAQEPTTWGSDLSKIIGAAHGLEVPFVFGHFELGSLGKRLFTDEAKADREALSAAMRGAWTTFARTGAPGTGGLPGQPEWKPWDDSSPEAPRALLFDVPGQGGLRPLADVQTLERVLRELEADPRLPGRADKCEVGQRLVKLRWATDEQVKGVCALTGTGSASSREKAAGE